ncbi:hypothetical protein COO55_05955 [Rhodococcus opacus]|nr:hypothetical protein FND50_13005 [Rhodococcus sp. WB9]RKM71641.1 hypothetical protein COO55_05955 [Rhodococcus opacus]
MTSTDWVAACWIDERTEPRMNPLTVSSSGCKGLGVFSVAGNRVSDDRLTSTPSVVELFDQRRASHARHVPATRDASNRQGLFM